MVAYGRNFPPELLRLPPLGCVNVHASLLPRHRGASPVQAAILAGDLETGASTMRMDEGLDTGPVYLERRVAIGERETAGALSSRLAAIGGELLVETLRGLEAGTLSPCPQRGEPSSCRPIRREDAAADWTRSADELSRRLRAFTPWPGLSRTSAANGSRSSRRIRRRGSSGSRANPATCASRAARSSPPRAKARRSSSSACSARDASRSRAPSSRGRCGSPLVPGVAVKRRPPATARGRAVEALRRVLERGERAGPLVGEMARGLSPPDQDLLRELVLGVLRWKASLDDEIAGMCRVPLPKLAPNLREILEVALYQARRLDRVPAYAAVSEAVDLARGSGGEGAARLVNGVLRGILLLPPPKPPEDGSGAAALARYYSHPPFLVERWLARFGPERTRAILEADNTPPRLDLLVNPRRGNRDALREALAREGVVTEASAVAPLALTVLSGNPLRTRAFSEGRFSVQDVGSQLMPLLLPEGDLLVDLAAAPGGKSLSAIAHGRARQALALDRSWGRLLRVVENARRLGVPEVRPVAADVAASPLSRPRSTVSSSTRRAAAPAPCARIPRSGTASRPRPSSGSPRRRRRPSPRPPRCSRPADFSSTRRAASRRRRTSAWSRRCSPARRSWRRRPSSRRRDSSRSSKARGSASCRTAAPTDSPRTCCGAAEATGPLRPP